MSNKLLILIDCQNDFATGTLCNSRTRIVIPHIVDKIERHDGTILAVHDTHFNQLQIDENVPLSDIKAYEFTLENSILPLHCIKLTYGWELEPHILKACEDKNQTTACFHCIDKYSIGFNDWKTHLQKYDFDEIELCGFNASSSILANAILIRTIYPNIKIYVDMNCIAGTTADDETFACHCMEKNLINVVSNLI